MGDIKKNETQKVVLELREQIKSMTVDMRMFSLSMRALYTAKAVGTKKEAAEKFKKLRDDTRNDAMVYLHHVLPLSTKFVASLSEYFEYYIALDFDEWCKNISQIYKETVGYRELADTLVKMHEDVLVTLKKRKDQAVLIVNDLKELTEEYERKKKELEAKANSKHKWAFGFSLFPGLGTIASTALKALGDSDLAKSIAQGTQAKVQEEAAILVKESLIPALEAFIDGIRNAAGFFSVMEQELRKFEGKAEKSKTNPQYLYYKVMNLEAKDMNSICQVFYAVLPDVKSDFEAIPSEGTDQNYVDRWLEKQEKMIKENCKSAIIGTVMSLVVPAIKAKGAKAEAPDLS